ncbi:hypothetical protein AURANDRAFT_71102, partial [Aureococcus anophagefferens]
AGPRRRAARRARRARRRLLELRRRPRRLLGLRLQRRVRLRRVEPALRHRRRLEELRRVHARHHERRRRLRRERDPRPERVVPRGLDGLRREVLLRAGRAEFLARVRRERVRAGLARLRRRRGHECLHLRDLHQEPGPAPLDRAQRRRRRRRVRLLRGHVRGHVLPELGRGRAQRLGVHGRGLRHDDPVQRRLERRRLPRDDELEYGRALPLREVGPHARADGGLRHLEHRRDVPRRRRGDPGRRGRRRDLDERGLRLGLRARRALRADNVPNYDHIHRKNQDPKDEPQHREPRGRGEGRRRARGTVENVPGQVPGLRRRRRPRAGRRRGVAREIRPPRRRARPGAGAGDDRRRRVARGAAPRGLLGDRGLLRAVLVAARRRRRHADAPKGDAAAARAEAPPLAPPRRRGLRRDRRVEAVGRAPPQGPGPRREDARARGPVHGRDRGAHAGLPGLRLRDPRGRGEGRPRERREAPRERRARHPRPPGRPRRRRAAERGPPGQHDPGLCVAQAHPPLHGRVLRQSRETAGPRAQRVPRQGLRGPPRPAPQRHHAPDRRRPHADHPGPRVHARVLRRRRHGRARARPQPVDRRRAAAHRQDRPILRDERAEALNFGG